MCLIKLTFLPQLSWKYAWFSFPVFFEDAGCDTASMLLYSGRPWLTLTRFTSICKRSLGLTVNSNITLSFIKSHTLNTLLIRHGVRSSKLVRQIISSPFLAPSFPLPSLPIISFPSLLSPFSVLFLFSSILFFLLPLPEGIRGNKPDKISEVVNARMYVTSRPLWSNKICAWEILYSFVTYKISLT